MSGRSALTFLAATAFLAASGAASASDVVVTVSGLEAATGEIGCALFSRAEGFPLEHGAADLQRSPTRMNGESCRFRDVKPGVYALAVSQFAAGQAKLETDWFGRPMQPWGVSNNIRPSLRAPRFDEAAFAVPGQGEVRLNIRFKK